MAYTEAVGRANRRYRAKAYDWIEISPVKAEGAAIRAAAAARGESVQAWLLGAARQRMEREGTAPLPQDPPTSGS